jgi:hypothetical protein
MTIENDLDMSVVEFRFITSPTDGVHEWVDGHIRHASRHLHSPACSCLPWEDCEECSSASRERGTERAYKLAHADDAAVMWLVTLPATIWPTVDALVIGSDGIARLPPS